MMKRMCLVAVLSAFPLFAKSIEDTKVDSVVYDKPTEWRVYAAGAPVAAFAVQRDLLWYATETGVGTCSLKKNDNQKFPLLGTIPSTDVSCMAVDASGKVWIGGKNGVAFKSEKDKDFTAFTKGKGLPDDVVTCISPAHDGSVWVGTENGAAYFRSGSWKIFTADNGLPSNKIQCMAIDTKGTVWIGTDKGIATYDGVKWTVYNMKKGLSWNDTKAIGVDIRNNMIWAAVGEKDVNSFDGQSWNTYMDILGGINSIMIDTQGRVWLGSPTGLIKFNGDEWISDPKKLGIPAAKIASMNRDEGGNMWFGMESGVLRYANPYPF